MRSQYATMIRAALAALVLTLAFGGCGLNRFGQGEGDPNAGVGGTGGAESSATTTSTATQSNSSSSTGPQGMMQKPLCGNGVLEEGEDCDDGNDVMDDGCGPKCQFRFDCESDEANTVQIGFGKIGPISVDPAGQSQKSTPGICAQEPETSDEMIIIEPEQDGYLHINLEGAGDKLFYLLGSCNGVAPFSCNTAEGDSVASSKFEVKQGSRAYLVIEDASSVPITYELHLKLTGCGDGTVQQEDGEECDDGNQLDDDGCDSNCIIKCPPGWMLCDKTKHCYRRDSIDADWGPAKSHCQSLLYGGQNAHLATIVDDEEMSCAYAVTSAGTKTWLGASDQQTEGSFAWQTGEPWTWPYKASPPWKSSSEPNDSFGEDCLEIWHSYKSGLSSAKSGFNDEDCGSNRAALCEWIPPGLPSVP